MAAQQGHRGALVAPGRAVTQPRAAPAHLEERGLTAALAIGAPAGAVQVTAARAGAVPMTAARAGAVPAGAVTVAAAPGRSTSAGRQARAVAKAASAPAAGRASAAASHATRGAIPHLRRRGRRGSGRAPVIHDGPRIASTAAARGRPDPAVAPGSGRRRPHAGSFARRQPVRSVPHATGDRPRTAPVHGSRNRVCLMTSTCVCWTARSERSCAH